MSMIEALRKAHRDRLEGIRQKTEAQVAEQSEWFRPVAIALHTKKVVAFTILTDPWNAMQFTFECQVLHEGQEKQWEILSEAIRATFKKIYWRQAEEGKVQPTLVGWECTVDWTGHRTEVHFSAPKE